MLNLIQDLFGIGEILIRWLADSLTIYNNPFYSEDITYNRPNPDVNLNINLTDIN